MGESSKGQPSRAARPVGNKDMVGRESGETGKEHEHEHGKGGRATCTSDASRKDVKTTPGLLPLAVGKSLQMATAKPSDTVMLVFDDVC